jgi:CP family cyanate transporter-like MFS transporter
MTRSARAAGGTGALLALMVAATALRPQLVGIGPIIPDLRVDLGLAHWEAGLLGTLPVLCMGLFALPAGRVAVRFGTRPAIGVCLAMIAGAGLARALAGAALPLIAFTLPIGIGMGVAGALLPVAAKEGFAARPARATGVYTTGIQIGALAATLAAVPLAVSGSWHLALAVFSLAAALAAGAWLVLAPTAARPRRTAGRADLRRAASRPGVWNVAAAFALMSVIYYGLVAWLAGVFVERGWSEAKAGGLLVALSVAQVPGGLLVASVADGDRRERLILAAALATAAGTLGLATLPGLAWAWAVLVGAGIGALFPLVLTMPLDLAGEPAEVGAIAGVVLGAGYSVAAIAPVGLGAVRDLTGSFAGALWTLVGAAVLLVALLRRWASGDDRRPRPPVAATGPGALATPMTGDPRVDWLLRTGLEHARRRTAAAEPGRSDEQGRK